MEESGKPAPHDETPHLSHVPSSIMPPPPPPETEPGSSTSAAPMVSADFMPSESIYPTPRPRPDFVSQQPPVPEALSPSSSSQNGINPQPVVHVLSPRGVEYVFLTIALFTAAIGMTSILLSLVNGKTDFAVLSFPVAVLVVSVPVFSWLFLRLKQAELLNPSLQLDASKRRSTQFTQIVTFLVVFFTSIGFLTAIFAKMAGQYDGSVIKLLLDVIVILGVSGGILFYYWRDEHKLI
jgi:hypothetical protein